MVLWPYMILWSCMILWSYMILWPCMILWSYMILGPYMVLWSYILWSYMILWSCMILGSYMILWSYMIPWSRIMLLVLYRGAADPIKVGPRPASVNAYSRTRWNLRSSSAILASIFLYFAHRIDQRSARQLVPAQRKKREDK